MASATERWDVFLSYAREDDPAFVRDLHSLLAGPPRGFSVWYDRKKMPSRGRGFVEEIARAIAGSERLLLVLGEKALRSGYVRAEWQYALAQDVAVVPLLRLRTPPPDEKQAYERVPPELRSLHVENVSGLSAAECVDLVAGKLREPLPPLGPLSTGVPQPPPCFQPRPDVISELARRIIVTRPAQLADPRRFVVLHGMSGTGKSVSAAAFARSRNTRLAFAHGVAWLSAPRAASETEEGGVDLRDLLERELRRLPAGGSPLGLSDLGRPGVRLLVVVDDATAARPLSFLWNALGPGCRVLVTTQRADLAVGLGAEEQKLEPLPPDDALMLLARFSGTTPEALPDDGRQVAVRCGGVAFALAVAGAMAADGDSWSDLRAKLDHRDLAALAHEFPNYPHPSVFAMLDLAVRRLTAEEQVLFRSLHVFSRTLPVPEAVVMSFWSRIGQGRPDQLRSLITRLDRLSLLAAEGRTPDRLLRIHDLLALYCRPSDPGNERATAAALLDAYEAEHGRNLPGPPERAYWLRALVPHMDQADAVEAAFELLGRLDGGVSDWYAAKLADGDFAGYLADVRVAWAMQERHTATPAELARLVWYALLATSSRAAAASLPEGVWGTLAASGAVPVRTLLSQAALLGEPAARARVLLDLLESVPGEGRSSLIADIQQAAAESAPLDRVELLSRLARHVGDAQVAALREACTASALSQSGPARALALSCMAAEPRLAAPSECVDEAFALAIREADDPLAQGALVALMPALNAERRGEAIDLVVRTGLPEQTAWATGERSARRSRLSRMLECADPVRAKVLTDAAVKDGADPREAGAFEPFAAFLPEDLLRSRWDSARRALEEARDEFTLDHGVAPLVEAVRLMSRRGPVPELVEEACAAARRMTGLDGSFGSYGKPMALARLVELCPEPQRAAVWEEALSSALGMEDRDKQVRVLQLIAEKAPPGRRADVLRRAWIRAQSVSDDSEVLWAVAAAAGVADAAGVEEALRITRERKRALERDHALVVVAERIAELGDPERGLALVEELDARSTGRIEGIGRLARLLPEKVLDAVWRRIDLTLWLRYPLGVHATAQFVKRRPALAQEVLSRAAHEGETDWRAFVVALAGHGLLVEALRVGRAVSTGDDPVWLVASAAPDDSDPAQVREFLSLLGPRYPPPGRRRVIARLGPKLVGDAAFEQALDTLDLRPGGADWYEVGVAALAESTDQRRESLFSIALDSVLGWGDAPDRARGLGLLARCVPPSAREALERAVNAQDERYHRHFIPLAGRLAETGSVEDALRFARGLPTSGSRARALCLVAPHAGGLRMGVVREALETATADPDRHERSRALSDAVELAKVAPRQESTALFGETLHRLARRPRPELLNDLGPLVTWVDALGGGEAILGVIRALREVTARWQ